ncbi:uncharacterized protein LOC143023129 isoform X2 [Oratosquilla oratoria]|uniref:uncharacterized protein LOC143023129 isoform X2 n=1 Tax=Oratosquilla oratoria TaxID=337810 RepID=UPI003F7734F9
MKAGDVCRCISNFTGVLPEELSICRDDIAQVHKVVDKHWLEGESGGVVGRFPSSCVVKVPLPPHPAHLPLFVATAHFTAAQAGDLALVRGEFVVGLNPVDESWWCGQCENRTGIFPVNFVWQINKEIIEEDETGEKPVKMLARVKASIKAQLPEELDLYLGDIVTITHIVDKDWYRGESNGATGIFPSGFVEIIEESCTTEDSSSSKIADFDMQLNQPCTVEVRNEIPPESGLSIELSPQLSEYQGHENFQPSVEKVEEPPSYSTNSFGDNSHWKNTNGDDNSIFEDDYFKQNMPSMFSGTSAGSRQSGASGAQGDVSVSASASVDNSSLQNRYENVDSVSQNSDALANRYENVFSEETCGKSASSAFNQAKTQPEKEVASSNSSLSLLVDNYFSKNWPQSSSNMISVDGSTNNNNLENEFDSLVSPGYNEDNTGIKPYGRAIFSFKAQYPNELSFRKGDIIHLIKHIDSHWTLGMLADSKGIFPSSYMDIIVDCPFSSEQMFLARRDDSASYHNYQSHATALYNFKGEQPGDVTLSKGEVVKITKIVDNNWVVVETKEGACGMCPKNYLSILIDPYVQDIMRSTHELDSEETCGSVQDVLTKTTIEPIKSAVEAVKPEAEPVPVTRSVKPVAKTANVSVESISHSYEAPEVEKPIPLPRKEVPLAVQPSTKPNVGNVSPNVGNVSPNVGNVSPYLSSNRRSYNKDDFGSIKQQQYEDVLAKNLEVLNVSLKSGAGVGQQHPEAESMFASRESEIEKQIEATGFQSSVGAHPEKDDEEKPRRPPAPEPRPAPRTVDPVYSKVSKKKSSSPANGRGSRKEAAQEESNSCFPDDVTHVSSSDDLEAAAVSGEQSITSVVTPHRPAPPPPPDGMTGDQEEFYSLPPEGTDTEDTEDRRISMSEMKENAMAKGKTNTRRELVQEMVTTEHEYIHDLEALVQVMGLAKRQKEAANFDIKTVLGNMNEVIQVAKDFLAGMHKVGYKEDEELMVGPLFLEHADNLCQVYKVYCANHFFVEKMIKKYDGEEDGKALLTWIMTELRQHKIQLFDLGSVLIKPIQRILKYPLFVDRLVSETLESHPDWPLLCEAKTKMSNVAKEINEHTKRMNLVSKYRSGVDESFQSKMQKVSMHSVAKKSARISTMLSASLGIMSQTKDPIFDAEEEKFLCCQRLTTALVRDAEAVLCSVQARHTAEYGAAEGVAMIYLKDARSPEIESIRNATKETCGRILGQFERIMLTTVIAPLKHLVQYFKAPERLIQKRHDKLLDYDNAQYKLDKNRDPTRTRILEEELSQVKGTYEAMNTQLLEELPLLNFHATQLVAILLKSMVGARMNLHGHLARQYLQLAMIPELALKGKGDAMQQFRYQYLHQVGELRQLTFVPASYFPPSPPRAKPRTSKTSVDNSVPKGPKANTEAKTKVSGLYPSNDLYIVTEVHTPKDVMELTLYPGDMVALIKNKDPLGNIGRWFVDDGDSKGFVQASCLRPANQQAQPSVRPSSSTLPSQGHPVMQAPSRPSTLSTNTVPTPQALPPPEHPPRYEDIFPGSPLNQSVQPTMQLRQPPPPPQYCNVDSGLPREEMPPRYYSSIPPKPGAPSGVQEEPVLEDAYCSPSKESQVSNEYCMPITDDNNIYEEIQQENEEGAEGVKETSPIYEVIPEDEVETDAADGKVPIPSSESDEPQFYYALYNFGGSDSCQLNLKEGQVVLVLEASGAWWFVEDRQGTQGYVPASYLNKYT